MIVPLGAAVWVTTRYGNNYGGAVVVASEPREYDIDMVTNESLGVGVLEIQCLDRSSMPVDVATHAYQALRPHIISLSPTPAPDPKPLASAGATWRFEVPAGRYAIQVTDTENLQYTIIGPKDIFVQPGATVPVTVERPAVARCLVLLAPPDKREGDLLGHILSASLTASGSNDPSETRPILHMTSERAWTAATQPICGRPLRLGGWHPIGTYRLHMHIDGYAPVDTLIHVSGNEEPALVVLIPT